MKFQLNVISKLIKFMKNSQIEKRTALLVIFIGKIYIYIYIYQTLYKDDKNE